MGSIAMQVQISMDKGITTMSINNGGSMIMTSIHDRCINQDLGRVVIGVINAMVSNTRGIQRSNLVVQGGLLLVIVVVVVLLVDVVKLVIKGVVALRNIVDMIKMIIEIGVLGGLR